MAMCIPDPILCVQRQFAQYIFTSMFSVFMCEVSLPCLAGLRVSLLSSKRK